MIDLYNIALIKVSKWRRTDIDKSSVEWKNAEQQLRRALDIALAEYSIVYNQVELTKLTAGYGDKENLIRQQPVRNYSWLMKIFGLFFFTLFVLFSIFWVVNNNESLKNNIFGYNST